MLAKPKVQQLLKRAIFFAAMFMVAWVSAQVARTQPADGEKKFVEIKDLPDGNGGTWNLPNRNNKEFKKRLFEIQDWRNKGKCPTAEDERFWDDYYKFRIAEFTWRENLDSLPKKRDDFKKNLRQCYNNEARVLDLHIRLNNQLLQTLPLLITNGAYSPIARVNWTLMLGDLNEKEISSGGSSAIPHPGALAPLTNLFSDAKLPDEIRATAMVGIQRQIQNPSKDQKKDDLKKTIDALRGVVNLQADATVKNRPGIVWLRRQGCMALGNLALSKSDDVRSAANNLTVVTDVHELARDQAADLNTRCRAAYTLGTLQSRDYPKNFVRTAIQSIADLAVAISKSGDTSSAPELVFYLTCLQTALQGAEVNRGIVPLADIEKDSQDLVKALLAKIDAALKILSAPNVSEEQISAALDELRQEVEKLVPPGAGPGPTNTPTPPAAVAPQTTAPPATGASRVGPPNRSTGTVGVKE